MDIKEKALVRTTAPIDRVHHNPFRNFDINPIRDRQVKRLQVGIEDIGMWSGLAVRRIPDSVPAVYQLACGHHRLEALKRSGISNVNLDVRPYTDDQMIKIMVEENMTQRGNDHTGTVLDSVAAVIVQIVRECSEEGDKCTLPEVRGNIEAGKGVGHKTICKRQSTITERNARAAIRIFKVAGKISDLIEKGGASKDVVDLYRADEVDVNSNILKAVSMFKKPAHGEAFANATMVDGKMCDLLEEDYIECAQNILDDDQWVTPAIVEREVLSFFAVKRPTDSEAGVSSETAVPSDQLDSDIQTSESENKPEISHEIEEVQEVAVQSTQGKNASPTAIDTDASPSPVDDGVRTNTNSDSPTPASGEEVTDKMKELHCYLETLVKDQIESGWPVMTRSGVISFLSRMIEMIVVDEARSGDFSIEKAFADRAANWLDKIDDGSKWQEAIKEMRSHIDSTIKKAA